MSSITFLLLVFRQILRVIKSRCKRVIYVQKCTLFVIISPVLNSFRTIKFPMFFQSERETGWDERLVSTLLAVIAVCT